MAMTAESQGAPRARAALGKSPFHELRRLSVERQGEAVLVSGIVSSFYHKQLAQEVVRAVCHGINVVNAIDVRQG